MIRRRLKPKGPRIDYSLFAIPKTRSIAAEKAEKESTFDKQLRDAYLRAHPEAGAA